jgi:hypothetical protein
MKIVQDVAFWMAARPMERTKISVLESCMIFNLYGEFWVMINDE